MNKGLYEKTDGAGGAVGDCWSWPEDFEEIQDTLILGVSAVYIKNWRAAVVGMSARLQVYIKPERPNCRRRAERAGRINDSAYGIKQTHATSW